MKNLIYADNSATTAIAGEVAEAMRPYLNEFFFNPSSLYAPAARVAEDVKAARKIVANFLGGANESEVLFTSCATESNNTAIFGAAAANPKRRHLITSAVEHPAVLETFKEMKRRGCEITILPVDRFGQISMRDFVRSLRPEETLLISLMHANNETGVLFPIAELSRIAKETDSKILFHTDATQSAGKIPFGLSTDFTHVDMFSFSGHKMHAPKGIGVLFVRRGTPLAPLLFGGHQESGQRGGTENVPYIIGLAKACELAQTAYGEEERIRVLRDWLEAEILANTTHVEVNGKGAARLPTVLNLACHFVEGESLLLQLDAQGICASSGSACSSGSLEPSHVLRAMGVPFTALHGSIRFSFSRYTTRAEVEKIADVFPKAIANLRQLSPYWNQKNNTPCENV